MPGRTIDLTVAQEAVRLYCQGLSHRRIGEKLKVSRQTIGAMIRGEWRIKIGGTKGKNHPLRGDAPFTQFPFTSPVSRCRCGAMVHQPCIRCALDREQARRLPPRDESPEVALELDAETEARYLEIRRLKEQQAAEGIPEQRSVLGKRKHRPAEAAA
jgi:predicted DNA-binding protein (UPF0251 family)